MSTFAEDLHCARFERLAHLLTDIEGCLAALPPEDRAEYERCQQSIIDAAIWFRPPGA